MPMCNIKKAVVTGATGFLGSHLVEELVSHHIEVYAVCRPDSPNIGRISHFEGVTIVSCQLSQSQNLVSTLSAQCPDIFYHLAWEDASGPGRINERKQVQNVVFAIDALRVAMQLGCRKFVATGTVYEKLCEGISEQDRFFSSAYYLFSKRYAHEMLREMALRCGMEFVWCTFFHPIGKYIKPEQMMAYTIESLLKHISPTFGPAQEPYDIVAVEDIAYGLFLAGSTKLSLQEYYIGSGSPRRLEEYLQETKKILKSDTPLLIGSREDDGMRFSFNWYSIEAFVKETGYTPKVSFEAAVTKTANWLRNLEYQGYER